MRSKFIMFLGVILFVFSFILAIQGVASTNTLPVAIGGTVGVDSNAVITTPAGFVSSNGFSQVNPSVLLYDEPFTGWGTADGVTWTNSTGWTSTAEVTNGVCNLATHSLLSPWITGRGIEAITVTWSNLAFFTSTVNYSTNDVDWMTLADLTDLRISAAGYRLRVTAVSSLPPPGSDPVALLDRVVIRGHQFPTRIGTTNDFAGIVFRVDNPVGTRDAVNLQTLESRLAAYVMGGHSAEGWSQFSASNDVDLAGHALKLDSRYTLSVVGDAVTLSMGGATVFEIVGANTCTPRIVSFQVAGTNLTAEVIGVTGWRPYPQWSTNLTIGSWTSLTTNEVTSTFPDITNGAFRLSWGSGTNAVEFWRILAMDETGGTNGQGLATFHVPVSVPALFVAGREVSPYSPSWVSNADYAVSSGTSSVSLASDFATRAGAAQMATSSISAGYATNAGNSSTAGYSVDGAHAARSDSSLTSAYSTNSRTAATSTYATNAGYSTSAGYAATAGSSSNSSYAVHAGLADVAYGADRGIWDYDWHDFGSAAGLSASSVSRTDQSNTHAIWTTQRCDAVEILDSTIVTNVSILTNLTVSGSANPSPNGIYWNFGVNWAPTNINSDAFIYTDSGFWMLLYTAVLPYAYWTNSTMIGNYNPMVTYDGTSWTNTGTAVVSIYNITTNTTYTTNRPVRIRLNGSGIEFQGTNATWQSLSAITGVLTNGSGAVTGLVHSTIRYLGTP